MGSSPPIFINPKAPKFLLDPKEQEGVLENVLQVTLLDGAEPDMIYGNKKYNAYPQCLNALNVIHCAQHFIYICSP